MVTFIRLMNQRLKTKRHWHTNKKEKRVHLLNAGHTFLCSSFVLCLFVPSFPFFSSLSSFSSFFFFLLFLAACMLLQVGFSSTYGSLIWLRTNCPRSFPLTGRPHVAESQPTSPQSISRRMAWCTTSASTQAGTRHRQPWRSSSTHD